MPDLKLVRKVLRSLPSKFNMKVTAIKEANDLSKMKLDELFVSLRTFELHLGEGKSKRKTGIALTSVKEEGIEESKVSANEESVAESIKLLTKQENYGRGEKDYETLKVEKNSKGIKCHECEGFGHIQSECATYLKRKKKSLVATLSDEENYSESDNEEVGMTLISSNTINEEGVENVISQVPDQQAKMLNKSLNESSLKRKWEEDQATIVYQQERIQGLMEENQSFLSSIVTLKAELKEARNQFEELSKSIKMMTSGTHKLDDLLGQGKRSDDKRGLGFSERGSDRTKNKTVFVRESKSYDNQRKIAKEKKTEDTILPIKHMTGNASFFSELSRCNVESAMFDDGEK
ncbi:gag-pol polyprotein [Cucumis melo var. makuwa]|uniref:Gag-pol polyprotein n=1 Tax=Cucumis melo var. makuwa TaxID=1194695 RepID=A0A5D3DZR7_CUCMM|nr:gag-pol polyprotein [Cucumis melo var. makuwa]TYK29112.1 gag-pol polyprotein [Cucumis melo var. makuwa]